MCYMVGMGRTGIIRDGMYEENWGMTAPVSSPRMCPTSSYTAYYLSKCVYKLFVFINVCLQF